MSRHFDRRVAAGLATAAAFAAMVPAAFAAGGPDIASSAGVVPGQQMFGDTSAGTFSCGPADFWHIDLLAGDRATIDWSSLRDSDGNHYAYEMWLYPAGTTDFSVNNVDPTEEYGIGSNDRAESKFVAGTAGRYPLIFTKSGCEDRSTGGPFSFTAYVTHGVVAGMGSVRGLSDRRGAVTLAAHRPDGQPISDPALRLTLMAGWRGRRAHAVASTSPVNGAAKVSVTLPRSARGKKVTFRTVASGTGYRTARTSARTVRVHR